MTPESMVSELTEYFTGSYSAKLLDEILKVCRNINEIDRMHVCEVIREDNAPNFRIGVKGIVDACRKIGVLYHKPQDYYVPAQDWTCDACGIGFKYAQIVTYDDKHDRGIFDLCPRCGFSPAYTMDADFITRKQRGKVPEKYDQWKAYYLDRYRTREKEERQKPEGVKRYKGWMFDKQEDDDFMALRRKEEIEAMKEAARKEMEKASTAKRWDLMERGGK